MSESLSFDVRCFPCWSAGRTKAPWQCSDSRSFEDALGYRVRWLCWDLPLRIKVSSSHAGMNCWTLWPLPENSVPKWMLWISSLTRDIKKERDLTVSILIDSFYSRFSGKDTGYFICWGTKWRKCKDGKTRNGIYRQLLCVRCFAEWFPCIISINSLNNPMIYL